MERISRNELFVQMTNLIGLRSTCTRAQVGALVHRGGRVISTGYAGAPSGIGHCNDSNCGHMKRNSEKEGCQRTIHAEANAIAFAARYGVKLEGCTLYTSLSPCLECAKLIINSGITEVVYITPYRDASGILLLKKVGIGVTRGRP